MSVRRKRWIIAPLTAVMVMLSLAFGVSPAAAVPTGQACKYDYFTYNACLNVYYNESAPYSHNVMVGIDLKMPGGYPRQAMRRGSYFQARFYPTETDYSVGIVLPVRSGWPQAGNYVLSAQFGLDISQSQLPAGRYQAEIVFTEVHADGSRTTRTYKTGIIYDTVSAPPPPCPWFCS